MNELMERVRGLLRKIRRHAGGFPGVARLPASEDPRTAEFVSSPFFTDTIAPMTGLSEDDIRLTSTLDSLLNAHNLRSPRPDNPSFVPRRGDERIVFNPADVERPDTPFHEAMHVLERQHQDDPEFQEMMERLEILRQRMIDSGSTAYATQTPQEMLAEAGVSALPALRREGQVRDRTARVLENTQPGTVDMVEFLSALPPFRR